MKESRRRRHSQILEVRCRVRQGYNKCRVQRIETAGSSSNHCIDGLTNLSSIPIQNQVNMGGMNLTLIKKSPAVPDTVHFVGGWTFKGADNLAPNEASAESVCIMYDSALQSPCCSARVKMTVIIWKYWLTWFVLNFKPIT